MKVICIDAKEDDYRPQELKNRHLLGLTLDKSYEVTWVDNKWYEIINDDGFKTFYDKARFINLAQWREKQIDSILGD